jgi:hypothetical protein
MLGAGSLLSYSSSFELVVLDKYDSLCVILDDDALILTWKHPEKLLRVVIEIRAFKNRQGYYLL